MLNVKDYGAVGNGTTDDYAAIASALDDARKTGAYGTGDEGSVVYFPPGVYRITQPLNCTNGQYNLKGDGAFQSVIRGETGAGNAIVDFSGSVFCSMQDLMLDTPKAADPGASTTNSSTVGVLLARTKDASGNPNQAGNFNIIDCTVSLHHDMSANGSRGTVALYDYAAEVCDFHGAYLRADTALVYTQSNLYGLDSVHRPHTSTNGMININASMTTCTVGGATSLISYGGPALVLNGAASIHVDAFYGCQGSPQYPYAVEVLAQATELELAGYAEGYLVFLRNRSLISGMRLEPMVWTQSQTTYINSGAHPTTAPVVLLDPVDSSHPVAIVDSILNPVPVPDTASTVTYLIDQAVNLTTGATAAACSVTGCQIFLRNGDVRIQNPWSNSVLQGNLIVASRNLSSITLTAPTQSGNVIVAPDKTSVSGVVLDGGRLGVGNSATGSTLGTVVKKVEIFNASGTSLGFVPVYNSIT